MSGEDPVGTLECPPGFVLDEKLGMCVSENPTTQAQMNFQPSDKMERCIQSVKATMRKSRKKMNDKDLKSAAIAICRSRLGK